MMPPPESATGKDTMAIPALRASHAALDRGDWPQAARGYLEILACQPENIEARAGLGTCFLEAGTTPEGLAQLADPARLTAAANILHELACALAFAGRAAEAERLLGSLRILAPRHGRGPATLERVRAMQREEGRG